MSYYGTRNYNGIGVLKKLQSSNFFVRNAG